MKKIIYIIIIVIGGLSTSCKDYLDVVPDNVATLDHAFSSKVNARKFLFSIYSAIPIPSSPYQNFALNAGDEIWYPPSEVNRTGVRIAQGYQSVSNPSGDKISGTTKNNLYVAITNCNIFIENIDRVLEMNEYEKVEWKAEAVFLKAYLHFYLARMYGPIVISDEAVPVSESSDKVHKLRSTVEETFTYIVNQLDDAIEKLPLTLQYETEDMGRVTKVVAAAIKAEVLITYASPLFNGNSIYSSFINKDGENMFPVSYDLTKWERAAVATKEAIELSEQAGMRLVQKQDYSNPFPVSDFTLLKSSLRMRVAEKWNTEIIWGHTGSTNQIQYDAMPRLYNYTYNPVASRHAPTLRIAEMYYSKNGVPIDEDIDFDYSNRYNLKTSYEEDKYQVELGQKTAILNFNRETRFYADIGFDRGVWFENGRELDSDPWYIHARKGEFASVFEVSQYSVTGYWPKKLIALKTQVNSGTWLTQEQYSFPIIRLSDLYLYYAEALNESKGSPDAQVYEYIDLIRERAGLESVVNSWNAHSSNPSKPSTQEGMRKIIQQERLIEMSFEGNRFWDLRRWKLSKEYMSKPIRGWNVLFKDASDYYTVLTLFSPSFSERDYLWPIPENEILKNTNLVQNPGW